MEGDALYSRTLRFKLRQHSLETVFVSQLGKKWVFLSQTKLPSPTAFCNTQVLEASITSFSSRGTKSVTHSLSRRMVDSGGIPCFDSQEVAAY